MGNFIAAVANSASAGFLERLEFAEVESRVPVYEMVLPDELADITASDHLNYWALGFDAVMITDTAHFRNPNYHTVDDTYETLDFWKMQLQMQSVIDMVVEAVLRLR